MIFEPLMIDGAWRVRLEPHEDNRGFFARTFCTDEFAAHGLEQVFQQSSLSRNIACGTLRGMHYRDAGYEETKLVRCVRGRVLDVVLDARAGSSTFGRWIGEELSAENGVALYIGAGLAHGFQTLEDHSDVLYQITPAHVPGHDLGIRWDDPAFGIDWPMDRPILSARDAGYPDHAA